MMNQSKNLIKILTIFSTNLYTLEDKTMNQRANEYNLNKEQFERLLDLYIETIIDSMSLEDFQQYVRDDMNDFLYKCSESEVIDEIKYTLDDEMLEEFVKQIKGKITG